MTYTERSLADEFERAFEHWLGDATSRPWSDLADAIARCVVRGEVSLDDAARMDHLLRRTRPDEGRSECAACGCTAPGMTHP